MQNNECPKRSTIYVVRERQQAQVEQVECSSWNRCEYLMWILLLGFIFKVVIEKRYKRGSEFNINEENKQQTNNYNNNV